MKNLIITPKTKIFDLLDAYPQLEELLIEFAPPFKKLKNPVLRNTIARITTINQAASIGNLNVEELVNRLRREVGQDIKVIDDDNKSEYVTQQPDWFNPVLIGETIDIREMLHQGEHPVHIVLAAIKKLEEGKILRIIAPFMPAPLIDKAISMGSRHWIDKRGLNLFDIYFIP